jgi:MerR family transcriptional regulator, light-induced transcriptional regulator
MRTETVTSTIQRMTSPEVAELGLTVAVVARRLGVAPATLRTWSRRYGLGPDQHSAGTHRRYTAEDLARLELMQSLTLRGVAPAQAAAAALAAEVDPATAGTAYADALAAAAAVGDLPEGVGRAGGGAVLPLGSVDPRTRGLARAAQALDAPRVTATLSEALARDGVAVAWESLIKPVLVAIGRRWSEGKIGIDVEHLLSECVVSALRDAVRQQPDPVSSRPVLLACAPEEQHTLPIHAVAAALAERRVDVRILGARVPNEALIEAMRRCGPGAVFIWSQLEATGDAAQFASLPRTRPAARLVAGGPGWSRSLPDNVARADSLPEAVSLLARAAG